MQHPTVLYPSIEVGRLLCNLVRVGRIKLNQRANLFSDLSEILINAL